MNPCPVLDARTATIFLFFIAVRGRTPEATQIATGRNAARLCCVTSRDAGRSWGAARDLTEEAVGGAEHGRRGVGGGCAGHSPASRAGLTGEGWGSQRGGVCTGSGVRMVGGGGGSRYRSQGCLLHPPKLRATHPVSWGCRPPKPSVL